MEISPRPFPSHFSHITHTFVAHSRQHFSCEAQLFFMPHQTGAHMIPTTTTRQGGCGSSGLPNVYSTVLENNFGKWPNGVDITANVMCQRQKNWKTGAQPMEEERKCQHEFISQMSCLCCVCLRFWSGSMRVCVCVSMGEWIRHVFNI